MTEIKRKQILEKDEDPWPTIDYKGDHTAGRSAHVSQYYIDDRNDPETAFLDLRFSDDGPSAKYGDVIEQDQERHSVGLVIDHIRGFDEDATPVAKVVDEMVFADELGDNGRQSGDRGKKEKVLREVESSGPIPDPGKEFPTATKAIFDSQQREAVLEVQPEPETGVKLPEEPRPLDKPEKIPSPPKTDPDHSHIHPQSKPEHVLPVTVIPEASGNVDLVPGAPIATQIAEPIGSDICVKDIESDFWPAVVSEQTANQDKVEEKEAGQKERMIDMEESGLGPEITPGVDTELQSKGPEKAFLHSAPCATSGVSTTKQVKAKKEQSLDRIPEITTRAHTLEEHGLPKGSGKVANIFPSLQRVSVRRPSQDSGDHKSKAVTSTAALATSILSATRAIDKHGKANEKEAAHHEEPSFSAKGPDPRRDRQVSPVKGRTDPFTEHQMIPASDAHVSPPGPKKVRAIGDTGQFIPAHPHRDQDQHGEADSTSSEPELPNIQDTPRRQPQPVDSTSKERSSTLFLSSPSTRTDVDHSSPVPQKLVVTNIHRSPAARSGRENIEDSSQQIMQLKHSGKVGIQI
jgi:hypothetical protein